MKEAIIALIVANAFVPTYTVDVIEENQEQYFMANGKYEQLILEGHMYVHEYVTPSGEAGYQILYMEEGDVISVGYGPEAESRTFNRIIEKVEEN